MLMCNSLCQIASQVPFPAEGNVTELEALFKPQIMNGICAKQQATDP